MSDTLDDLQAHAHFVRIEDADGVPVGCGCLVSGPAIITCAHVVAQALGSDNDGGARPKPDRPVRVRFPVSNTPNTVYQADVLKWYPNDDTLQQQSQTHTLIDIAVLDLRKPPPKGTREAEISPDLVWEGESFTALGYPEH